MALFNMQVEGSRVPAVACHRDMEELPAEDLAAPCVTLSFSNELKQSHFVCSVLKLGRWEYCAGN